MIIRNVMIHDAIHREPYQGDIVIRDGKLVSVGGKPRKRMRKSWMLPG